VEKGEDSLGAGAKFPIAPSTCRVRSINAQSSLWAISGGVIPFFGREARRKSRSRIPMWICPRLLWKSMRTACAQVEKPLAYQRPAGRGHERPKRSLFGPVLSPPNVDKPEDSLGGVCKNPCRSATCRSRARNAHGSGVMRAVLWTGSAWGKADRLVPMECGQASEQSHNKYRNPLCDSHLRGAVKE